MELTDINVNIALDEIRPYNEADGGYLEFIGIEHTNSGAIVMVKLLGACTTCVMSAATLKQGVESHLKAKWPEIDQVIQI